MTWVKSRLVRPDGTPVVGQCVTATLLSRPSWLSNRSGQALGVVRANTDHTGLWRMDLLPHNQFETGDSVYYQINEGRGMPTWTIRVPPASNTTPEHWMRDLLVDPPPPPPFPDWRPISTLGRLHNVDPLADSPPDGQVLGSKDGSWGLVPFKLSHLVDIDQETLTQAQPGSQLVLLPSGKWGVFAGPFHLAVEWDADETYPTGVWVTVHGATPLGARVQWGDNSAPTDVMPDEPVRHVYPAGEATYTLIARDKAFPLVQGTAKILISEHSPEIHAYLDADDDWRVLLWINEPADGTKYQIDWGDDESDIVNGQSRIPPLPRTPHDYTRIGHWPIVVKNLSTKRVSRITIDTGDVGVAYTFDRGPYQPRLAALWLKTGATVKITSTHPGAYPIFVQVPPSGRINFLAPRPMPAGNWRFGVEEIVDEVVRRSTFRRVTVPNQWDWVLNTWIGWRRQHLQPDLHDEEPYDETEQRVWVQAKNARATCIVSWDDGAPSERLEPGATLMHIYTLPMPTNGRLLRIEEDPALLPPGAQARVFTRLLGEPRYIGTPVLNARSAGSVDLDVAGIEGDSNGDWYQVNWGDGSTTDEIGAIGRWYPAHHTYSAEGQYTITVDGPGMPKPITRVVQVVNYPAPTVAATEDTAAADPQHLTAAISVNNRDSGGPVLMRFGDDTPPVQVGETAVISHRFPDLGPDNPMTYYVIVESLADRTAKGRVAITVPYTTRPPGTIEFEIRRYGSDPFAAEVMVTKGNADKQLVLDWGDGASQDIGVSAPAHHLYLVPRTYTVAVGYDDGSETVAQDLDIPWPSGSTP